MNINKLTMRFFWVSILTQIISVYFYIFFVGKGFPYILSGR